MKKTKHPESNDCRQIKILLLEKSPDSCSAAERLLISKHLSECDNCRQFQLLVSNLEKTTSLPSPDFLTPDPQIYRSLINRWSILHPTPVRKTGKFRETIKAVMSYRVPAYQVVMGLLIAVILAGVYYYLPFSDWQSKPPAVSQPTSDQIRSEFSDVFIRLDFTTAGNFGINMKEDSILTRFFRSSM
jgi:hypothetical protein